ncbi:hypothetical protein AGABI2DRAFT_193132 [Agaricus bisporus var. bisporus H97]|uniref:hypothetical protein n=1 Tax=Agaricus bisporus var. bisporus (strain H97 / ATCC MYA-4626 / FGSC 10389) TaxID=936046 RepID=UPI00029F6DEB|nr:hypothetical protein AGABI2DRAFT_193132 [Agaricus bisporus var. bisporus H97]EKV46409.1 hypothetical protein AGABI2DRAFT_193132 [Agaricus bisporus var. bisporus H97]
MATPVPPQTIGKRSRNLTPSRRSTSSSISTASPPSSSSSPESKIARSSAPLGNSYQGAGGDKQQQRPILCTLPPTCNRQHTTLANSKDLERHYATYHAHVCESPGCGCVFPEAKLLELHQTECHDPVAAVRKERGEKIFGCMVPTCDRLFQSPKARRLHMIEAHKFPKEFFFSVTNKGIGGLLQKWGEGASMVRREWKPREGEQNKHTKDEGGGMTVDHNEEEEVEDSSSEEEVKEVDMEESEKTPRPTIKPLHPVSPPQDAKAKASASADVDALAEGVSSLSLVPSSIRFGRGGRGKSLGVRVRGRGGRGGIVPPQFVSPDGGGGHQKSASMSDSNMSATPSGAGRGRGAKRAGGRGRRLTTSVGGSAGIHKSEAGGEVVLVPSATGQENRGKRGGMTGTL